MISGSGTVVTYPAGAVSSQGTVVHVADTGDGRRAVVLDETAFHPVDTAWPDQPADRGVLHIGGADLPILDAVVGALGYVASGLHTDSLPGYSLGFVYLPALLALVIGSIATAPLGARAAHKLPVPTLRRIFAGLLYVLATKMLLTYW